MVAKEKIQEVTEVCPSWLTQSYRMTVSLQKTRGSHHKTRSVNRKKKLDQLARKDIIFGT